MSKFLRKLDQKGIISITSTQNNTIITLSDLQGSTKLSLSAGTLGFKNSRKSTTYAAQAVAEQIALKALKLGIHSVIIKLKGFGYGKESSIRALYNSTLSIVKITEQTPIAHNGCRKPKRRRV